MSNDKLGATGRFPQGVLNENDEGELRLAVARDPVDGLVHINFGKPVAWVALLPDQARAFAAIIIKHAGNAP